MTDLRTAIIQVRPSGEGPLKAVRLEVASISYGFSNGPCGSDATLIFCNADGKRIGEVSMAESQLDPELAHMIYRLATNRKPAGQQIVEDLTKAFVGDDDSPPPLSGIGG